MSRVGGKTFVTRMIVLCLFWCMIFFSACDSNVDANEDQDSELSSSHIKSSSSKAKSSSSKKAYPDTFKPNDKEYPYAGIPRIVIETEYKQKVNDRETEIPAKMQIWGDSTAESEIMDLTIRGRGNTSWWDMPKKSFKIEFIRKQPILGMPKDKDWALIANYADKSLLKNYMTYRLASWLGAKYAPRSHHVELYLNGEYLGVYLLTETVKKGKNRVDINDSAFLAEFDVKQKTKDVGFLTERQNKKITIHYPKEPSEEKIEMLKFHIDSLERFFDNEKIDSLTLSQVVDIEEYLHFYCIQEFSKNKDGAFSTSVYFTWEKGVPLSMAPVWDFDLAYGGNYGGDVIANGEWYVKKFYWNRRLFSEGFFVELARDYWIRNLKIFQSTQDSVLSYKEYLKKSAKNNFKRWPILKDTTNKWHNISFDDYNSAVDSLVGWISYRIRWIEENLQSIRNE